MDFLLRCLFALAFTSTAFAAAENTPPYLSEFEESQLTHTLERVETPPSILLRLTQARSYADLQSDPLVILDKIINVGQNVWKIIQENKPVVTIHTIFANALPAGVVTSAALEGFSNLRYTSYKRSAKNAFGANAYEIIYTVVHRYGGRYRGRGQYLDNVTVLPASIKASWGYNVDMGVQEVATSALRVGEHPIARVLLTLELKISSVARNSKFQTLYEFTGDSPEHETVSDELMDME